MGRAFDHAEYSPLYSALAHNGLQINGNMEVSQENAFNTPLTLTNNLPKYICDQWQAYYSHTAATAVFTGAVATGASPPLGSNAGYLELKATTASAMAGAGDLAIITQPIEGYRWQKLAWGFSNAQSVTIGFWTFCTIAGTATVALRNASVNRSYVANFTVNSPNTWEYKTVVVPGDTTGTWASTNSFGVGVAFCFGAGSSFIGTNATWNAGNYLKTSSTTNFFPTNNNRCIIAGVTVMPGTDTPNSATAQLLQRPYDVELQLCRRYYELFGMTAVTTNPPFGNTSWYKASKRVSPALTLVVGAANSATVIGMTGSPLEGIRQNTTASAAVDQIYVADARF